MEFAHVQVDDDPEQLKVTIREISDGPANNDSA